MRLFPKTRRSRILAVVGVLVLAAAGSAFAAWMLSGSGSGRGRSGSAVSLTVTAVESTHQLYPGGTGGVSFTVANPNSFPATLDSAAFSGVTSDDNVNCPSADLSLAMASADLSAYHLVAGASTTIDIPGVVSAGLDLPDGCQGVGFAVGTSVTGHAG